MGPAMPRASLIVLALIVLPFAAVGDPVRAETVRSAAGVATPSPAPPTPPTKLTKVTDFPPIVFFVARGEADACGRDCAEWIAADGAIDLGAPARLRALLNRLGRRRLPIYFHSPGGSVSGALAIGRLLRERGLTAGLAWTVPQGCDPKVRREAACDKL
jgi:hypothetical protein